MSSVYEHDVPGLKPPYQVIAMCGELAMCYRGNAVSDMAFQNNQSGYGTWCDHVTGCLARATLKLRFRDQS